MTFCSHVVPKISRKQRVSKRRFFLNPFTQWPWPMSMHCNIILIDDFVSFNLVCIEIRLTFSYLVQLASRPVLTANNFWPHSSKWRHLISYGQGTRVLHSHLLRSSSCLLRTLFFWRNYSLVPLSLNFPSNISFCCVQSNCDVCQLVFWFRQLVCVIYKS